MPLNIGTNPEALLVYACIDRITGEEVPILIQMLLDAGAKNVNIVQAFGKKNRPVFLAFIDIKESNKDRVIDILTFQWQVTGWHIFSTKHEYVVTSELQTDITLCVNGITHDIPVSYKIVENEDGWKKFLLESDEIHDHYIQEGRDLSISYIDYKSMIIRELYAIHDKGELY